MKRLQIHVYDIYLRIINRQLITGGQMKLRITAIFLLLCVCSFAGADGLPMKPGKWEMTMTMQMSMLPAPQVRTYTECITEEELSPESFDMDEDSECQPSDFVVDGNTASWSIACPGPAGEMTGQWEFTSDGDEVSGNGSMSANMGGMSMQMNMTWEGNRLGDCD